MPRQSRGRSSSAPRSATPAQSRGAHTSAVPANHTSQPPAVPASSAKKEPGMIAQMAATAGSVAIGSTIGHGISSMLFGGSSSAPVDSQAPPQQAYQAQQAGGLNCDAMAKDFTKCLDSGAGLDSCNYYLEQLKACQAAAAPY